ncbi:hypothetical protein AB0F88_12620 [Streptosporangium sp. NPDC023963]
MRKVVKDVRAAPGSAVRRVIRRLRVNGVNLVESLLVGVDRAVTG